MSISYIVLCFNDHENFKLTLDSLENELLIDDELIVIDSSKDTEIAIDILKSKNFKCKVNNFYLDPSGVFPAYNFGVKKSSKKFIQKINSGDTLIKGARKIIQFNLEKFKDVSIFVYHQRTTGVGKNDLIFYPSSNSIWPLQSVIAEKQIFIKQGFYDESYKYNADQNFFMIARKVYKFKIFDDILTTYDSFGISAGFNCQHFKEHFTLRKLQGHNTLVSFYLAGIRPFFRICIQKIFGDRFVFFLKNKIFKHYKKIQ
mgnify:CR=1 FL=1|tara:strand:- start:5747 stop:6520 length:774 start_codon:yes stop_codon:yes gene_type:complete